jgi:hypothetical protein
MTDLAIFRVGDIGSFPVMIELNNICRAGFNTGVAAYATGNFIDWHCLLLPNLHFN